MGEAQWLRSDLSAGQVVAVGAPSGLPIPVDVLTQLTVRERGPGDHELDAELPIGAALSLLVGASFGAPTDSPGLRGIARVHVWLDGSGVPEGLELTGEDFEWQDPPPPELWPGDVRTSAVVTFSDRGQPVSITVPDESQVLG